MLAVLWLVAAAVTATVTATHADHCGTDGDDAGDVACRVLALDAAGESLLAVPAATARLSVTCSALAQHESALRPHYFRRLSALTDLALADCRLPELPTDAFAGLRRLRALSVRGRDVDSSVELALAPDAFRGPLDLRALDLSHNRLRDVGERAFCSLERLHTLNLTHNRLSSAERLGFGRGRCGASVVALDLSRNRLAALDADWDATRMRRLQRLHLRHNNISRVAPAALASLPALRHLDLSHNAVPTLPAGLFADARDLRELHLSDNLLSALPGGTFRGLERLLVLQLSSNLLTSDRVADDAFAGLVRMVALDLSHNALTRLDGHTFKDLFFLQTLELRNNSIGYVEPDAFLPLSNLHALDLAENRLHEVDERLFSGLHVLSRLTLNSNLLVSVHEHAFANCSDLKELDLSSNRIIEVPRAILDLTFLKTLDLGENRISDFKNGSFKNLAQLTGLRLIENQIGNLTVGMFWDLPSLQVLNLAKNKIQLIERGTFDRNSQLEAIRLDGNFVSDINGVFSSLASLLWLNLSENHLVWFDYAFIPSNLKWLDIHGNFIEHLGNYYKLQEQIRVKTLDASHNRLVEISPMSIPNSVELLFINNNFIKNVQVNSFADKLNLTRVDMYANEIKKLELNSLRLSPVAAERSLPEFYIGGNPFHCDCDMEWLPLINNMTSARRHPRLMDLENVVCTLTHARSVTNLPLDSLKPSDFLCPYDTHCFALCRCCEFDACDCEMTCPENCSCYRDPLWSTNVVDCSGRRAADVPSRIPVDATDVYLDGNSFGELRNHGFVGRRSMRALYANGSGIEVIGNRTFAGLSALRVLSLASNSLRELRGYEFERLANLSELFLQNNLIGHIADATFAPLASLRLLRLDGNRLVDFSLWNLNGNVLLRALSIGDNPWSCECEYSREMSAYLERHSLAAAAADVRCWERRRDDGACGSPRAGPGGALPAAASALAGCLLLALAAALLFACREPLYRYCCCSGSDDDGDRELPYDAYVCYSPKDEEFVVRSLAAELEPTYRLCLQHRDVPATRAARAAAAAASRRVLLVLTRNYMQTEWTRGDVRRALHAAVARGERGRLVLLEEGGAAAAEAARDPELRPYVASGVRVRWCERRFRRRLRSALPEPRRRPPRAAAPPPTAPPPAYASDCRPHSDHIYSSIDSDYSTLERGGGAGGGGRRREARHWPPPPPLLDPAASRAPGQAYLV